jgi:hypothetical protein
MEWPITVSIDPLPVSAPVLMRELGNSDAAPNLVPAELLAMQGLTSSPFLDPSGMLGF